MNNVDLLASQLEADPCNTIVAAMLTDEIMEARDMPRTEADRHVAGIIQTATWRREFDLVHALWSASALDRHRMQARIFAELPHVETPYSGPYLLCGDAPPYATARDWHGDGMHYAYYEVCVGCSWVYQTLTTTQRHEAEQRHRDKHKSKRRRRR